MQRRHFKSKILISIIVCIFSVFLLANQSKAAIQDYYEWDGDLVRGIRRMDI